MNASKPKYTVLQLQKLIKANQITPEIIAEVKAWYLANLDKMTVGVEYAFNRIIQDMMKAGGQ